jgi:hypothetical protein
MIKWSFWCAENEIVAHSQQLMTRMNNTIVYFHKTDQFHINNDDKQRKKKLSKTAQIWKNVFFSENIWILTRGLSPSRRVLRRAYKALDQLGLGEVHLLPAHQKCSAPSPSSLGDTQPRLKDNIGITGVIKKTILQNQFLNEWHTHRDWFIL